MLRRIGKEVDVIAHPDIWQPKYSRRKNEPDRYIGIPFQQRELENLGARFKLSKESVKITDDIMTTGEVPMVTDLSKSMKVYLLKKTPVGSLISSLMTRL